jgi:prevent-host-death family protein
MQMTATEFKAKCLAAIDRVRERGEPIVITKRGRIVASLVPAGDRDERPWARLRGMARWTGDPFAPAIKESEVEALR